MFGLLKGMFVELLSLCRVEGFRGSLASNYKGPMKCGSLNN